MKLGTGAESLSHRPHISCHNKHRTQAAWKQARRLCLPDQRRHSTDAVARSLFHTNHFDLSFSLVLSFKGRRTDLDPSRLGRTGFHDLTFLGGFFLNDVVVGARGKT